MRVIGIDYSGAATDDTPLAGLAAWMASTSRVMPVTRTQEPGPARSWSRNALTERLAQEMESGACLVVIDHAFAYSAEALDKLKVRAWDDLPGRLDRLGSLSALRDRVGHVAGWRLADLAAPGTQDPLGVRTFRPVSHSTFHGIRQLGRLRGLADFHLWPFDGWRPKSGRSVVAEGFPNLLRRRVATTAATRDERDAEALARFFWQRWRGKVLGQLFEPALTGTEKAPARREGWILGVG